MRFFQLFFLAALSATILTGCERQFVSPIDPTDPLPPNTQFVQMALSSLADTAAERSFVDLANAANEVAEALEMETGTTAGPVFLKLAHEARALQRGFASADCEIALGKFATLSSLAAVEPNDTEQVLANLAQEVLNTEKILQQFPTENAFIPFAFGYALGVDAYADYEFEYHGIFTPSYELGEILIQYDATSRPITQTRTAVIEFLTLKGYVVQVERAHGIEFINLGASVDPLPITKELITIPGVALANVHVLPYIAVVLEPPPLNVEIIDWIRTKYNKAWCQGNFNVIDSILIEESGLDFFDYAFVRNLVDIYVEEVPKAAERIQTNSFSLRPIAITFLGIYFQHSEKSHEEIIELFRQSIRTGYYVTIEHLKHGICAVECTSALE